jgi:hypothetical protein
MLITIMLCLSTIGIFGSLGSIVSGIAGVKGLFDSFNQGKASSRASNAAADAQARQVALAEENHALKKEWMNQLRARYDQMKADGLFDLPTRIQLARNEVDDVRRDNLEGLAANLKTMGYKPGDTAMEKGFAETEALDAKNWARMTDDLRTRIPNEEISVLMAMNPELENPGQLMAALGSSADASRYEAQRRAALAGDPSRFLAGMQPFLEGFGGQAGSQNAPVKPVDPFRKRGGYLPEEPTGQGVWL